MRPITLISVAAAVLSACRAGGPAPQPPAPTPAPPPLELRFFALGDTGSGGPEQFQVGRAVAARCRVERCDFGLLLGDNFYPDGVTSPHDDQWRTKFEEPYAELLSAGVRFYAVPGNHDYGDGRDAGRVAHQVARARLDPRFVMPAPHFSFEQSLALFIGLDTQRLGFDDGAFAEQETLLPERGLAASAPRPWVVAFGHHPYRSNGPNGDARPPLSRFLENVVCPRADLYLAGHDHNLQVLRAPECRALLVVTGGGGYRTYDLPGVHPTVFQARSHGFAYFVLTRERLRVEMIDAEGTPLFSHEIDR